MEALHSHREKLWRNVSPGQCWAGKEALPAQTETPGQDMGMDPLCQGLSPVGELLLFPITQKEILHPTELLSAPLKKQRPKQRINSSSASSTSQ